VGAPQFRRQLFLFGRIMDNKKYYYLKMKENYFDSEEMKILESQKNGIQYQNLYLKLCLLSLKENGKLIFKGCLPYDLPMLSTILRVDIDTVKTGIELFARLKLIDILENGVMFMSDIQALIGHGSSEAERKAEYRERIKNDQQEVNGTLSGQVPPELEIELEINKKIEIQKSPQAADNHSLKSEDIKSVYNKYPSRCYISNRSTGKNKKNRDKIRALLKNGQSKESLINLIELYVADCQKTKTFMKNFGTFLNNLPDKESLDTIPREKKMTAWQQRELRRIEEEEARTTLKKIGIG
jgi:predicted phage replisome organizer